LFDLAEADELLDVVADDLRQIGKLIDANRNLARAVRSPVVSRDDQGRAMAALAEKAGFNDLTRRFLGVLARNRRLFALDAVIAAYLTLLAQGRGETTVDVIAARELTGEQLAGVRAALAKAVGGGVVLNARVDPSLLGGLVVKVGSRMVDSSLRTKLQQLRLAMKGIG